MCIIVQPHNRAGSEILLNFGNSAGFSDFEIFVEGNKVRVVRVEVYPSKISYKEDYQATLADISDEINNAVLESNGMFSFEPKDKPTTKKDIGISNQNKGLVYNLIIEHT